MSFEPSEYSDADAPASSEAAPSTLASKLQALVSGVASGDSAQLSAWANVINAISDPRMRVATLKAKIKNYKAMRDKFPEPVKTLYKNQIVLMQSRLKAEERNLELEVAGESSTSTWRTIGHGLGYAAIVLVGLGGAFVAVKTYRTATAPHAGT